jgi:hypothetical protein
VRKISLFVVLMAWLFVAVGCSGGGNSGAVGTSDTGAKPTATATTTGTATQESAEPTSEESANASTAGASSPSFSAEPEPSKLADSGKVNATEAPTSSVSAEPSSEAKPTESATTPVATPEVDSITLAVIGNDKWGAILLPESVMLAKGDTAVSVLKRVAKKHRLSYGIRGSGALTYVEGIDGLFEFDDGPTSGWKFSVNGVVPDIGAGAYELKPGDIVEWYYTSEDEAAVADGSKETTP